MEQICAKTNSSHQALSNEQIQSEEIGAKGGPTLPESGGQYERRNGNAAAGKGFNACSLPLA
jgi:hypothetical protein